MSALIPPIMRQIRLLFALPVLASLLAPASGCGPTISTYLILSSQAELDGALAAEADKYAPYEYTAAEQYLAKAREEQGYADFGPAVSYAYKAQSLARKSRKRAAEEREKQTPPSDQPPIVIDEDDAQAQPVIIRKNGTAKDDTVEEKKIIIVPAQPPQLTPPLFLASPTWRAASAPQRAWHEPPSPPPHSFPTPRVACSDPGAEWRALTRLLRGPRHSCSSRGGASGHREGT